MSPYANSTNVCLFLVPQDYVLSGSGDAQVPEISPSSQEQFYSDTLWAQWTHPLPLPGCVLVLLPYLTHVATHLWRCVQEYSRAGEYMQ